MSEAETLVMQWPSRYVLGNITLDIEEQIIRGPRGHITLSKPIYVLAERLLRRPGAMVMFSDLISAMYCDADDEPDNAEVILRDQMAMLRAAVKLLSAQTVLIRTERGVGYGMMLR